MQEKLKNNLAGLQEMRHKSIGRILNRLKNHYTLDIMSRLQKIGYQNCSFQHTGVFANIDPEGTNVVTLAERAGISKQAMSKLVKDIEELGFVETRKDPKDSRAILVQLNEKGTQFIIDVYNCIDDIRNELENVVGKENFDSFMGTAVLLNNYFDNKQQNSTNRDNFSLYPPLK